MELPAPVADLLRQAVRVLIVVDNARSPSSPISEISKQKLDSRGQERRSSRRPHVSGKVSGQHSTRRSSIEKPDTAAKDFTNGVPLTQSRWAASADAASPAATSIDDDEDEHNDPQGSALMVPKQALSPSHSTTSLGKWMSKAISVAPSIPLSPSPMVRSRWESFASSRSTMSDEPPRYTSRTSGGNTASPSSPSYPQQSPKAPLTIPIRQTSSLDIPTTRSS